MILRNAARCKSCLDVIQSYGRHDYEECYCGAIFVDGGHSYLRRGGHELDFEDLSIEIDTPFVPELIKLENSDTSMTAHAKGTCAGQICPLHRRTDHYMRSFEQSVAMIGEVLVMTRICPHGHEHLDPDDYATAMLDYCPECDMIEKHVIEFVPYETKE